MSIEYINFRNQKFYLHSSVTKKGNPRYYFSLKSPSEPVQTLPKGYEIYENPNGQVFLRKIVSNTITSAEIDIVQQAISKYSKIKNVKIDLKKNHILLYTPDQDINDISFLLETFVPSHKKEKIKDVFNNILTFSAVMRFELDDPDRRLFIPERFSHMGSEGMWIEIGDPGKIEILCKRYIKHLGQDSFYELGIF
jgi:hypothetical protein